MMPNPGPRPRATLWHPARRYVGLLTMVVAVLTGVAARVLGGSEAYLVGGIVYVALVALTVMTSAGLGLQLVAGLVLTGSFITGREGAELLVVLPILLGVVATCELSGVTHRLAMVMPRDPGEDLARIPLVIVASAGAFVATLVAGEVDGPQGPLAITLAVGACVILGLLLMDSAPDPDRDDGSRSG